MRIRQVALIVQGALTSHAIIRSIGMIFLSLFIHRWDEFIFLVPKFFIDTIFGI
jgi:hypothetical protein